MPTRKQRRRRAKEQRHEYEVVYVDADGNEVEVESDDERVRRARGDGKSKDGRSPKKGSSSAARDLQPPTWYRSARRALIMAPFFFVFLYVLQRSIVSAAAVSAFYAAVFIPFSYGIDKLVYRTQLKRLERS